jgi:molybdate transport system substrate-binding protein
MRLGKQGLRRRGLLAGPAVLLAACGLGGGSTARPAAPAAPPTPAATPEPKELVVLAAASLTDAFTEMGDDFPQQPATAGVQLTFSFAASSQLRTQLEQGAPADVFAAADTVQMDQAVASGVVQGPPQVFARNRLVVIVPKDNPAGITTLADLARPGLKLVTTAPEVPVGNYTRQMLQKLAGDPQYGAGFDQRVLGNVVSQETDVRQVVAKVQLGEADLGVVYATDVTPKVAPDLKALDVPERFNVVAQYPAAVAKAAKAPATAPRFLQYLVAPPGRAILAKYGFGPPG